MAVQSGGAIAVVDQESIEGPDTVHLTSINRMIEDCDSQLAPDGTRGFSIDQLKGKQLLQHCSSCLQG